MLDLNKVRADFAAYLAEHAATRHSLDAALMHVVEAAYQRGLADGQESEREACAMVCDGEASCEGIAQRCTDVIRARWQA